MAARKRPARAAAQSYLTKHSFDLILLQVKNALSEVHEATGRIQAAMRDLTELRDKTLTKQRKR